MDTTLTVERVTPDDREHWLRLRHGDITSTEVAALFGISPYMTEYELWHAKRESGPTEFEASERMQWGTRLERAIAKGVAEDRGWKVRALNQYIHDPELRIGASFDFERLDPVANLEVKNVDGLIFRDQWEQSDDGTIEAPLHIELQVQHQLLVSGRDLAYIAALVGGNRVIVEERRPDLAIHKRILGRVRAFWQSIEEGDEPTPDYLRDAVFIAGLYSHAEPDKVLQGDDVPADMRALVQEYTDAHEDLKAADGRKKSAKARMLELIDDAEKVVGDGFSVSAGLVGPKEIEAYTRKGYRNFRVYKKKGW